jgi:uncharacterized membrane protein YiaA
MVSAVDAQERRTYAARILGNIVLVVGLLISAAGLIADGMPAKGYFFAGLLVLIGLGLRLEAALGDRR